MCGNRVRKAKAHLEFNLVRDVKGFFKCIIFKMFFIFIFIALCHLVDSAFSISLSNRRSSNTLTDAIVTWLFHVLLIDDWVMQDLMMMHRISCLVTHFQMEGIKQT